MQTCRLCLHSGKENEMFSIFKNKTINFASKIWHCVAITVREDDRLSTIICLKCQEKIVQWEEFQNICHKSQYVLANTLKETDNAGLFKEPKASINTQNLNEKQIDKDSYSKIEEVDNKVNQYNTDSIHTIHTYNTEISSSEEDYDDINSDIIEDLDEKDNTNSNLTEHNYQCSICLTSLNNIFDYLDHQEFHNGQMVFECDRCQQVFDTRQKLVEHDQKHPIPCPQCQKMILPASLRLHLIMHTEKFKCSECSNCFNSQATLNEHFITMHTDIKNHVCETCGKCFKTLTAIKVHMKSHSDQRSYACKLCDYTGRTASAVYVHQSIHENDTRVCEVCSKTFKSNRNLHDHLRRVHYKEKKHVCNLCNKRFVEHYMLRIHQRCHTGIRPYKCTVCEKAFHRSDGLKAHMEIHGQRTLYDCPGCEKKFSCKRTLTRHFCTKSKLKQLQ